MNHKNSPICISLLSRVIIFNFAYEDMNYAGFPQKSSIYTEQNGWLRNVVYLWCALVVFQLGYAIYSVASISGKGFRVMIGFSCVVWAHFSKIKYSVFKAERGNLYVIQDKNHDKIINELNTRRKLQLLEWYGEVNPDNELEHKVGKFKWLVEQKVISKEECDQKIAQAKLLNIENYDLPGERLN